MTGRVFRDYSQAELDRAYDQPSWAANRTALLEEAARASEAVRARLDHRAGIRFGDHQAEMLDLYPATASGAPTVMFAHGGAWRSQTKDNVAFPAPTFVESGIHYVALGFANIPEIRLPEMAAQLRRGILWVTENAHSWGGDPARLYLIGHSSGAHLAAATLASLPPGVLRGALCVSGMYDLEAPLLSARSAYVKVDAAEADALSPARHIDRVPCPVALAYGERESPEFHRQARDFAARLEPAGKLHGVLVEPGLNHFELIATLADPASPLARFALDLVG